VDELPGGYDGQIGLKFLIRKILYFKVCEVSQLNTRSSAKVMPPIFFSVNVIAIHMDVSTSFSIMRLLLLKVSVIFNKLLPTLSKTLYKVL
jgi:hypothetical protein